MGIIIYNHGHIILRLSDNFTKFSFHHKWNKARLLAIDMVSVASSKMEIFVNSSTKLPKNGNWTFPLVPYFTWKLESVSNILSMIVVDFLAWVHSQVCYLETCNHQKKNIVSISL